MANNKNERYFAIVKDIVEKNSVFYGGIFEDSNKLLRSVMIQIESWRPMDMVIYDVNFVDEIIHKKKIKITTYEKYFINGYTDFHNKWFKEANLNDIRFWNTLSYLFNVRLKPHFYTCFTDYDEETIQQKFYNYGELQAYLDFELENSMPLLFFQLLEDSSKLRFTKKRKILKIGLEKPELDNKIKLRPKVEFIILNETGFIKNLIEKQYKNVTIAEIVSKQINELYKDFEIINKCTQKNIQNILSADYIKPNINNDKTAYKKNNIRLSLMRLKTMKIPFEDCLYLPEIKISNPELFD